MKPSLYNDRALAGTISLIITITVLGAISFGAYYLYQNIDDLKFWEDAGSTTTNGILGFATGSVGALFNFGKKIGTKWNPFD